jgi:hypothetical protein
MDHFIDITFLLRMTINELSINMQRLNIIAKKDSIEGLQITYKTSVFFNFILAGN